MPTTLYHHFSPPSPPFDHHDAPADDEFALKSCINKNNALYIISEHDYVHSLIPSAAAKRARTPSRSPVRRPLRQSRENSKKKLPRPLMATLTYTETSSMGLPGGPNSPPDLTNSKSSKSSSFHSSSLSDIMGPENLSHFEDINLDDLHGALGPSSFPLPGAGSNRLLYEAPRASFSSMSNSRTAPLPQHSFRDLTGGSKPRYPSLKGQVNSAVRQQGQLNAPTKSVRRGFTSPSAPTLANISTLSAPGRRSRSPSPNNPQTFPSAPRTLSRKSSRNLSVSPTKPFSSRRQSWQHGVRKTVKELEAECDDEDDEVPEDAFIWNVPISPRPAQERSPAPSACNSPPQTAVDHPTSQNGKTPSAKSSPGLPPPPGLGIKRVPMPQSTNLANDENSPPAPLTRQRTNTWEDTYTRLDDDAKKLTEALEEFQTEFEHQQGLKRQTSNASQASSIDQPNPKAKTQSLPPLRKSDPLVDPFQPSAEKQKYLSRTRPSWLPPKNPKEEKKHLKEYQKMLARIQEQEKLEAQKQEEEKNAREKAERVKAEYWETLLLPNWTREMSTPETKGSHRKMWWNGVPPKLRGVVWQQAIGNDLEISETTFTVALEKAKAELQSGGSESKMKMRYVEVVESTKAVFPELKMFAPKDGEVEEQPYHKDLVDVCLAYASYRSDVEALAGIHHIAAVFLLQLPPHASFSLIANLLNRPLPLSFLVRDHNATNAAYNTTLSALQKKSPSLASRLYDLRIEPNDYLRAWFEGIFCGTLGIEHASRVMDVYAIEGDKIPPRVAVAVLGLLEGRLLGGSAADVLDVLKSGNIREGADEFMGRVYEAGKSS
ncbi:hypothetical protein BDV96DRAFT_649159 [Lophiotrema nucula]|uniref:Rab-GAP TBC domain-containing protein n=1 Tax=Lophiotrema nucula TaxID=690887 RepID=A0A6A5YZY6_9PLEO|nr:hypothetical protein BDV96DRAFT_649159 [Lophiotrema nucula]